MGFGSGSGGRGGETARKISWAEVKKHNTSTDGWIVHQGKVYDVSKFYDHPGGRVVFNFAGQDASDVFAVFHPGSAHELLRERFVGELAEEKGAAEPTRQQQFEREVRRLRAEFVKEKLFESSGLYYVWKVLSTAALAFASVAVLHFRVAGAWSVPLAAVVMAFFFQQSGWLAHDFLHHQVFKNRLYGDVMGLLVGNVFQGFSVEWWKNKHNTHHAVPNLHESKTDSHDGDPDIDTLPLLAWSRYFAKKAASFTGFPRWLLRNQVFTFFPILTLARLSWMEQSLLFALNKESGWTGEKRMQALRLGWGELVGLLIHYGWFAGVMVAYCSPLEALVFGLGSECLCGILLSVAFVVGHNGMAYYDADKKPEFSELQVTTTRNVHDDPLTGWFMGGLHYQIEHHLFPAMPRHNLAKIKPRVEALCRKYDIPYRCTTLWQGLKEVVGCLDEVAHQIDSFPAI